MTWLKIGSAKGVRSTTSFDSTGANLLIAINHGNTGSISDNKGNTWQALPTHTGGGGSNTGMFYCDTPTVGAGHYATSSVSYDAVTLVAFSGANAPAFISETGSSVGGLNTTASPGSIAPPEDGCLIVSAVTHGESSSGASAGSGFTTDEDQAGVSGSYYGGGVAHLAQTTAAAVNPLWTWSGAGGSSAAIAVFKGAAGASVLSGSAAGSAQASGSAGLAAQVALSGVGVALAAGAGTPSVNVPLSAAGFSVASATASSSATVSLTAAALAQAAGAAGLSASVLLAGAGAALAAGNGALAAQLDALAAGAAQATGAANLTNNGTGDLSANGQAQASATALLSITINLVASGGAEATGNANGAASAPGALAAAGAGVTGGWATLSSLVTLTAAGFVHAMGSGAFSAEIPLLAAGQASAGGSAAASMAGLVRNFRLTLSPATPATRTEVSAVRLTTIQHEVTHG